MFIDFHVGLVPSQSLFSSGLTDSSYILNDTQFLSLETYGSLVATDGIDITSLAAYATETFKGTISATDGADTAAFWSGFTTNVGTIHMRADGRDVATFTGTTNLGYLKAWDGTKWHEYPAKYWNGSSWVKAKVRVFEYGVWRYPSG